MRWGKRSSSALAAVILAACTALPPAPGPVGEPSPSPSSAATAAPSTPAASPSASGAFVNAQWNYALDLNPGWRYSGALSLVPHGLRVDAARDTFTARTPEDEARAIASPPAADEFTLSIWMFWNPQGLSPVQWAEKFNVATNGPLGVIAPATVAGRAGAARSYPDGSPTYLFAADGILMYELAYQLGSTADPAAEAALRRMRDSFRFLDRTELSAGTGIVSGALAYPSDFLPAQSIYVISTVEPALLYRVDTTISHSQIWYRVVGIAPGSYVVVAYPATAAPGTTYGGVYSRASVSGCFDPKPPTASCADHRPASITVTAGVQTAGVDTRDWYGPPGSIPPRPTR